jgi:hypothetical protein
MVDEFSGVSVEGCEAQSWSPEVITLYGDAETVNRKLANFEMNLPRRRIFGFVVEGGGRTAGSFYERTGDQEVTVYRWSGASDPSLHVRIAEEIERNRGVNCIGEQTKALLAELPDLRTDESVAAPVNAKAAFSHQVRDAGADYVRTTVYLMC